MGPEGKEQKSWGQDWISIILLNGGESSRGWLAYICTIPIFVWVKLQLNIRFWALTLNKILMNKIQQGNYFVVYWERSWKNNKYCGKTKNEVYVKVHPAWKAHYKSFHRNTKLAINKMCLRHELYRIVAIIDLEVFA